MRLAMAAAAAIFAGCCTGATPDELALERYYEANELFEKGRYAEAIPLYESVVSVRDRLKDAHYKLAYCYEVRGEESHAVEALEKALRVDPQDEYALRHLWRLYCHRGFVDQALDVARRLSKLYPGDAGLRGEIARLESLKGK
jgi:tetratricopeptide (TPR) repeat protein